MAALSGRRNFSTDSQATMFGIGGRRQPFFVLDDQAVEDQYIFTSLRYDSHAKADKLNPACCKEAKSTYLFRYHFDRLKDGAGCRGWYDAQKCLKRPFDLHNRVVKAVSLYEEKSGLKSGSKGVYKVRIKLKYHGNIEINVSPDVSPYKKPLLYPTTLELFGHKHDASLRSGIYKAVLDALPTNKSLHTKAKTEWRSMYDYARVSAGIQSFQDAKEVLLFNAEGEIMDGSITTPYFYRNGRWITPHISCGGQAGVTRRWAVDQGLCNFGVIHVDSLRHDEVIWLSNAVKGFFTARFVACPDRCTAPSFRSKWSVSSGASTAVDTPISDKGRSQVWLPTMTEAEMDIDDMEDLSPRCTREAPISPIFSPVGHRLSHSLSDRHLKPVKSNKKQPLFRIPQFLGKGEKGSASPDLGAFSIDALAYSYAAA